MSALRGILIAFAVLLLAAIYLWGRREGRQRRTSDALQLTADAAAPERAASAIVGAADDAAGEPQPSIEPAASEPGNFASAAQFAVVDADSGVAPIESDAPYSVPAHKIIALRLVATAPRFSGAHLRTALEAESLHYGKYQIFHRTTAQGVLVFSVASMLEPGSFELDNMFHEQYPGIALFAQLPGVLDGVSTLNELISCARRLQETLGGILQDEHGTPLLAARIEQLRKAVREFEADQRQSRARSESSHP